MRNNDALITVAMLTTFLKKEGKDYLDLLNPFVLNLIPKSKGHLIDMEDIGTKLDEEYGIQDLPHNVMINILNRNAKQSVGILEKRYSKFYVKKAPDTKKFTNNFLQMKENTETIINALLEYFSKNKILGNNLTTHEAQELFVTFLETYGFSTIKNVHDLRGLTTSNESNRNNYHVARFILQECERKTATFDKIIELIKGFLIYKSIFYFSTERKKEISSNLKETDVYFDTSLIINALGYNSDEEELATNQLIKLINESGGHVKTFEHNKEEIAGILTKYARNPLLRNHMRLEFLSNNDYDEFDVLQLRSRLGINLKSINIEVVPSPSYGTIRDGEFADDRYIDYQGFKTFLESKVRYRGNEGSTALENDVKSISSISMLRGDSERYSVENCKAIFVTANMGIVHAVDDYFHERFTKGEISFAISEVDLTSLLWLKCFDKNEDIPRMKLMEVVYAAHQPSDGIIDSFFERVDKLNKEGSLTSEMALLMRTNVRIKNDLVEITENDPSKITDEVVKELEGRIIYSYREQDNRIIEALKVENRKYAREIDESKKQKNRAYEETEKTVRAKVNKLGEIMALVLKSVFVVILFVGLIAIALDISNKKLGVVSILLSVISILGLYDLFYSKYKCSRKFLERFKSRKFDKLYSKEVDKLNKIFK